MTYLVHHGIKGQKWGIRRYQNEDGTLTSEGKKRYGYDSSSERKTYESYSKNVAEANRYAKKAERQRNNSIGAASIGFAGSMALKSVIGGPAMMISAAAVGAIAATSLGASAVNRALSNKRRKVAQTIIDTTRSERPEWLYKD